MNTCNDQAQYKVYRGDTFKLTVDFTYTENGETTPLDITGWDIFSTLKSSPKLSDAEAEASIDLLNVSHFQAPDGILFLEYPSDVTKNLETGNYYLDVQIKIGTYVKTVLNGRLKVLSDITQRD